MYLDQDFFKTVVPNALFFGADMPKNAYFSVDSRLINSGDMYIALRGSRHDGHDFINDVIKKGASGIIIEQDKKECLNIIDKKILDTLFVALVPNTLQALVQLATAWREQFSYPVFAITGSVGKTSTKECLTAILEASGKKYLTSFGNQNTLIGISLNILKMRPEHEVAIFEMGINKRGEMAHMAALLKPTNALVTMIGHSHMEGLGSVQDIASEKRDIFKFFKEDSTGIVNGDQPLLANVSYIHPVIKFGCKTMNQIQARKVQVNGASLHFVLKIYNNKYKVVLPTSHIGFVYNTLAAVSAAYLLKISEAIIVETIQKPLYVESRFETCKLRDNKGIVINDCYNASPESMKAALLAFEKVECTGEKMAILGDMLELGVTWRFWHRQLGRLLRKAPSVRRLILVGDHVKFTLKTVPVNIKVEHVPTWQAATEKLEQALAPDSAILVKGSRGVGLDNLVNSIKQA
ncbi:MAG: UDP-N-acetylmuramoyl-tripeptide--D-alanyl-D-alanine ligase [Candidatus Babeliaceae bacterium]|jgi:UDP-N-acetylmuramoyl-tripeptide--D-alanyl-D-alanine ligase